MKEVDYDPATMKRATHSDITRIYRELWGSSLLNIRFVYEDGEWLDRTQYNYDSRVGGGVSHRSHKPAQSVATTEPATNEVTDAIQSKNQWYESLYKSYTENNSGQDE